MCDRNVKSEYILIKLCAIVFEYICERTAKFHEKILFAVARRLFLRQWLNILCAWPDVVLLWNIVATFTASRFTASRKHSLTTIFTAND